MKRTLNWVLAGTALAASASISDAQVPAPSDAPRTHSVEMVELSAAQFAFEPAHITVRPGDVIRFTQAGLLPHNVEFTEAPRAADLGDAQVGPFLTAQGQTYELVIDDRFVPGEYRFICTPHVAMGMKGTLVVEPSTR